MRLGWGRRVSKGCERGWRSVRRMAARPAPAGRRSPPIRSSSGPSTRARPALIAWSREDQVFPPSDAEALAAAFPHATLEWIDDAYAFSPEDQPARVAELIGAFARQPAGV